MYFFLRIALPVLRRMRWLGDEASNFRDHACGCSVTEPFSILQACVFAITGDEVAPAQYYRQLPTSGVGQIVLTQYNQTAT